MTKKLLLLLVLSINAFSVVHEYAEDSYYAPADQTIVDEVEKIAQLNDFTTPYEILIPKKPMLQMNVWTRTIAASNGGVNLVSGNPYIIINPSWASTLSKEQQTAIISIYFQRFKDTTYPYFIKYYLPYASGIIGFLIIISLIFLLGRIAYFIKKPRYYVILAAIFVNGVLQFTCVKKAVDMFNTKIVAAYYEKSFTQRALAVTHNKQAMTDVYEKFLAFCNQLIKDGQKNIEPACDAYVNLISYLKSQK